MVPYEAFLSAKPVVTTRRRRRPARGRARPRDRARRRARRRRARARPAPTSARTSTRRRRGAAPGKAVAERVTWDACVDALLADSMKVAYYSPLPPSRSGIADYSTLLLPALRERVDVVVAEPGKRAPAADVALYHVGNDPDAHGWIVDALRKRPGVVVLHEYVLHHLVAGITIGRGDGRGYLDAMERELGVAGRLLGLGVLDNLLPLLWETQPERFPLAGDDPRPRDRADRALATTSRSARARPGTAGRSGGSRIPAWPIGHVEPATDVARRPADRLLRLPEHEQADPAAARGVRVAAARAGRARGCCSSAPPASASTSSAGSSGSGSTEGVERLDYVPEERHVVADGRVRRARQPALPDDGRDVGLGDPRALARQAADRLRRRLVQPSCPTTSC